MHARLCAIAHMGTHVWWGKREENLEESVVSFCHAGLRIKLRLSDWIASTFADRGVTHPDAHIDAMAEETKA